MTATDPDLQDAALGLLRGTLLPGSRLATLTEHAPPSAGTVLVRVLVITGDRLWDVSEYAAVVLGIPWQPRRPGVAQRNYPGPGRSVMENLGRVLYPDGWACLGDDGCPSAEHFGGPGAAPRQAGLAHHDVAVFRHQEL